MAIINQTVPLCGKVRPPWSSEMFLPQGSYCQIGRADKPITTLEGSINPVRCLLLTSLGPCNLNLPLSLEAVIRKGGGVKMSAKRAVFSTFLQRRAWLNVFFSRKQGQIRKEEGEMEVPVPFEELFSAPALERKAERWVMSWKRAEQRGPSVCPPAKLNGAPHWCHFQSRDDQRSITLTDWGPAMSVAE